MSRLNLTCCDKPPAPRQIEYRHDLFPAANANQAIAQPDPEAYRSTAAHSLLNPCLELNRHQLGTKYGW